MGEDELVWINISLKRAARDNVVLPYFERMRAKLGNDRSDDGEVFELSDGRVLEVICAEGLAEPDYQEEEPALFLTVPVDNEISTESEETVI